MKTTKRFLTFIMVFMMVLSLCGAGLSYLEITPGALAITDETTKNDADTQDGTDDKTTEVKEKAVSDDKGSATSTPDKPADNTKEEGTSSGGKSNGSTEKSGDVKSDHSGTPLTRTVKASDGLEYRITASYGKETGIPEDAELRVEEVSPDDKEYKSLSNKSEKALENYQKQKDKKDNKKDSDKKSDNSGGFTLNSLQNIIFDIKITDADGNEYQPKKGTSVEVSVIVVPVAVEKEEYDEAYEEYVKSEKDSVNISDSKIADNLKNNIVKADGEGNEGIDAKALETISTNENQVVHIKENGRADVIEAESEPTKEGVAITFEADSFSYFIVSKSGIIFRDNIDVFTLLENRSGDGQYARISSAEEGDGIVPDYYDYDYAWGLYSYFYHASVVADKYLSTYGLSQKYLYSMSTYVSDSYRSTSPYPGSTLITALNKPSGSSILQGELTDYQSPYGVGAATDWNGKKKDQTSFNIRLSGFGSPYLAVMLFEERLTYLTITNNSSTALKITGIDLTGNNRDERYRETTASPRHGDQAFILPGIDCKTLSQLNSLENAMSYFKDLSSYNKTLAVGESITVIVPTAHGDGYSVSYQAVDSNSNPISNEALTYDLCGSGLKPATTSSSPSGGTVSSGNYPLRNRTDTSDNRRTLVFGEAVARVTKDVNTAEKTWTYHPYLINSAVKDGVKIGAFDQANSFTPSTAPDGVIIETLRESAEVGGTDRYSIGADGFTFGNETNNNNISLRTTSETDWNPNNGFKSIIKRGATGKSMVTFASPEKSFTLQSIILDGNYSDEAGSPQYECRNDAEGGTPYSGGLVNSTGTLNIDEGTVMQNTRTVGDGGAVAMSQGTTVNVNNASFNNCISTKRGGAIFAGTLTGIQDASDESVIYGVTVTGDISDGHTGTRFTNCVSNCAYPRNTAGADGGGGALFLSENSKSLIIKNPTKNKGEGLIDRPANYENSINNTEPGAQFVQDNYWKTYNEGPSNPFNPGVVFSDCSVQGNLLEKGGGAIMSRVSVDISNCRFERCETIRVRSTNSDSGSPALPGGAVLLKRAVITPSYTITARLDNCYFLECKSRSSGGAVEADTASDNDVNKDKDSLTIENCKFYRCITKEKEDMLSFDSGNVKGGGALGIYKYGDITVKNSNISECKGATGGGYGGAIRFSSNSSITLYNTLIDSCGRATAGKNNASDQGGAIGTASGTVNMGKCTVQNCEAKSGGAVYLSNSTLNIGINDTEKGIVRSYNTIIGNTADKGAGIYITRSKVCIAKNNNFGGADVVVDSNGNQVVNEDTLKMFNYAKGSIANNQYNGTLKYTKPRQDIYIADWAGPNSSSPSNNPPIRVDGEITSGNGTIWVWLDDTCTQNSTRVGKQFAAFNNFNVRLGIDVARTVESFRNARTDTDSKNKTGDYIRGSVKLENEVTPQKWIKIRSCIFWNGFEASGRRVVLRKVVKNGNHFSSKTGSATFTVYESDYTVNNPTSPISVGENGTQLSNLTLKNGGVIYVGEMPYGEYLIKESNGTWYFLIVHEKGVYVDDQLNTNVSEHGGFTGNTQADAINSAKADLNRAKAAYNLN